MEQIAALVGFSIIAAGTPGPNNLLLWASGAAFGFRRTLPHVVGTAVG
ncbi:MAG TPA: LysE family translocator, partial [Actinomycetota bacterium]|nr:LysE family translocator [Actinomycetota bacterium]